MFHQSAWRRSVSEYVRPDHDGARLMQYAPTNTLQTVNPGSGFHATISHHMDAEAAWPLATPMAMTAMAEATGCTQDELRANRCRGHLDLNSDR